MRDLPAACYSAAHLRMKLVTNLHSLVLDPDICELFATGKSNPARTALLAIDAKRLLYDCLSQASSGSDYILNACRTSYHHPNGFARLLLVDCRPRWALRLHVWQGPVARHDNDIHGHCGPVVSRLLCGRLLNTEYTAMSAGSAFLEHEDRLVGMVHTITPRGVAYLRLDSRKYLAAGDVYALRSNVIHRTTPLPPFPVVTLVADGARRRSVARVYRPRRRPEFEQVVTKCEPDEFSRILRKVLCQCFGG